MSNILILDTLGQRYGRLPSEVLASGSTLDLYVMDAAMSWHDVQQKRANGQVADTYTQDDMVAMLQRAKEQNGQVY